MSSSEVERETARHRLSAIIIFATLGLVAGRILSVSADHRRTPFLSANDRSRWCTVRALVDHGTFAIDEVIESVDGNNRFNKDWHSIDVVFHRGPDGKEHFYSSKPTLFPLLLAGEYWLMQRITGATLADDPFYVGRAMILLTNGGLLAIYLFLLASLIDRMANNEWEKGFALTLAALGTFLTSFAVTINNHLPAAVLTLSAIYFALPIWRQRDFSWWRFAATGLAAGLVFANELPALAFVALLGIALLWRNATRTLLAFVPAVAMVVAAMLATNIAAHGVWRPPYAMRDEGRIVASLPADLAGQFDRGECGLELVEAVKAIKMELAEGDSLWVLRPGERWSLLDRSSGDRFIVARTTQALEVRVRDNWYEFPGSYWSSGDLNGVDQGEASPWLYAFHVLVGHHGIFSLTPVWILTVAGIALALAGSNREEKEISVFVGLVSLIVLAFYLSRPTLDRNYGGVCCGLRWVFWLAPLWIIAMLPALRRVSASTWLRRASYGMLLISVLSAAYGSANPWKAPWIYAYLEYQGWLE